MLLFISCGGSDPGTAPSANPTPVPVAQSTPTPAPLARNLQPDTYCVPKPPPLAYLRVKVHDDRGYKKILDARAVVGPDAQFCAAQGQGGTVCVVRDENDPQAVTCNNLLAGKSDTGRYGPNWFYNDDKPCRPIGDGGNDPGCRLHETNQFLVYAFGPGKYTACSEDAVCTDFIVE
jgi:hypothetical protein